MEQQYIGNNGEETGLGFTNRNEKVVCLEDNGDIQYQIVFNNKETINLRMLIDLKNIFSRQLPKMPREYIVKLLFDRCHESLVITKINPVNNHRKVIGGICFRVYENKKFAEIAFLAVTAQEQVRGFGTRLMNQYKTIMQQRQIQYLLTYADNFAIGYFKKQGFTKDHQLTQEDWKGYIKEIGVKIKPVFNILDYDGGTFMECHVNPYIDYQNISKIIQLQKQLVIDTMIKLNKNQEIIYQNKLTKQDYNQMKNNLDSIIELIPGLKEAGWTKQDYIELRETKERSFYQSCKDIIEELLTHKSSWPFKDPVNSNEVVDYYDIIKNPMDLATMSTKLTQNIYNTKYDFEKDIKLIFDNCKTYNQPETVYYKAAQTLQAYIQPFLEKLKDDKNTSMVVENSNIKKKKNKH